MNCMTVAVRVLALVLRSTPVILWLQAKNICHCYRSKMQALAQCIKEIRDAASTDKLLALLAKSDASKQSMKDINILLNELDPSLDSVAYLFVLHAALAKHYDNHEALLSSMYLSQFCAFCNAADSATSASIQRALIYSVSRAITNACTHVRSIQHIKAAAEAVCKVVSSSNCMRDTICQLHVDALQLTLLGASLSPPAQSASVLCAALPVMADNILLPCEHALTSPQKPQLIQEHVFAYFYYSGCVFCGLSNFEAAADRFFLCVSAGAQGIAQGREPQLGREVSKEGTHEIVEAAHKKLILACLLSDNDDLSCLKHIPVARLQGYDSLVSVFSSCREKGKASLNSLRQIIAAYCDSFEADGNIELVMRLQDAYLLQAIRARSSTHAAVNVLQLCSDLNLPDSVPIPNCIQTLIDQARPAFTSWEESQAHTCCRVS